MGCVFVYSRAMRRLLVFAAPPLFAASLLFFSTSAQASPYAMTRFEPSSSAPAPEPSTPPSTSDAEQPTTPEGPAPSEPAAQESADTGSDATAGEEQVSLEKERETHTKRRGKGNVLNRHGVGVRGGIVVIPTWILNGFLATHTNALCRGDRIGNFAGGRGLNRQDGCNFYIGGEYIYRYSQIFDIVGAIGYQRAHAPTGFWLDKDEWADGCETHDGGDCDLAAADYTEVNMHVMFFEADFIARAPVVKTKDVEFGIGGGGGIGLGILFGGINQTPLGSPPGSPGNAGSCTTMDDLEDFTRCTPHWYDDPDRDQDGDGLKTGDQPPPDSDFSDPTLGGFASCTNDKCDARDLTLIGRNKQDDVPPVIPVVNLIVSARLIVKDVFGITVNGGFNTGFYFGGSLQYYFGSGGKK